MKIEDIIKTENTDFLKFHPNAVIQSSALSWGYAASVSLNGIIAVGWFKNDDILVINNDGIFQVEGRTGRILSEDYVSDFHKNISHNNLSYTVPYTGEKINVFGLRGGFGNCLTMDNKWYCEVISLSWDKRIARLQDARSNEFYYLKLFSVLYTDKMYLGFSNNEKQLLITGSNGLDIYTKKEH